MAEARALAARLRGVLAEVPSLVVCRGPAGAGDAMPLDLDEVESW